MEHLNSIVQGDCLDVMASMDEASVDSIITDPPYGLSDRTEDISKILCSMFFDVIFPSYNKMVTKSGEYSHLSLPCDRSTLLAFMDRTFWEEPLVRMPEGSIDFNNRVVLWDKEVKDTDISTATVPNRVLIEKANAHGLKEGLNLFLNLRPCRNASFSNSASCGVSELGNGIFRVPIVIPLDTCFAGLLSTLQPTESPFLANIVRFLNNPSSLPGRSSFVMTSRGAELRAILALDTRRGTVELLPARSTSTEDFLFELRCPQQIGAFTRTRCLPAELQAIRVCFIGDTTDRAFFLNFHKDIISLISRKVKGFKGKKWDHGVPSIPYWEAALRVAKPGAMLLAFGGTRTFHRLACAIEDAGWEIRDCMMWLYGSGFPKSHNVGNAMDKLHGMGNRGSAIASGSKYHATTGKARRPGDNLPKYDGRTAQGKVWSGWGTALKPAWEPIIVAMKPLDGTYAQNAEKHGVAGIWVDGGRIESGTEHYRGEIKHRNEGTWAKSRGMCTPGRGFVATDNPLGRFPANLILDEQAAAMLDKQSGESKDGIAVKHNKAGQDFQPSSVPFLGKYADNATDVGYGGSGGASRFFYTAKASRSEREAGLLGRSPCIKCGQLYNTTHLGANGKPVKCSRNNHPTVKPLKLMQYLCRLTKTPTGGIVLDPFAGSGTTCIAARNEGRDFIGIEKDPHYCEIARARLQLPMEEDKEMEQGESPKPKSGMFF